MENENKKTTGGLVALGICLILTVAIIVGCIFFGDEIFGFLLK